MSKIVAIFVPANNRAREAFCHASRNNAGCRDVRYRTNLASVAASGTTAQAAILLCLHRQHTGGSDFKLAEAVAALERAIQEWDSSAILARNAAAEYREFSHDWLAAAAAADRTAKLISLFLWELMQFHRGTLAERRLLAIERHRREHDSRKDNRV